MVVALTAVAATALASPAAAVGPRAAVATRAAESRTVRTVSYGPAAHQLLDLHLPAAGARRPLPILLYVHGGGWVSGSRTDVPDIAKRQQQLLREGVIVRPTHGFGAPGAVRITVGTHEDHDHLAEALARVLAAA